MYHLIAMLPAGKKKAIFNKSEDAILSHVISYVANGIITEKWGKKEQIYQALEIRIYQTKTLFNRRGGDTLDSLIKGNRNCYNKFREKAEMILAKNKYRVFIDMPIQGKKNGSQNEQRIYNEYDARFDTLRELLLQFNCVAIRIDKEHPIDQLVSRIKEEIKRSSFIIADLTDERPSCYFEAGYAEGLKIPVIYIASEESVIYPGQKTKIHFDIHMNVNFFSNVIELNDKLKKTIEKNKDYLLSNKRECLIVS